MRGSGTRQRPLSLLQKQNQNQKQNQKQYQNQKQNQNQKQRRLRYLHRKDRICDFCRVCRSRGRGLLIFEHTLI